MFLIDNDLDRAATSKPNSAAYGFRLCRIVEQSLNVPLWHLSLLPSAPASDKDESPTWNRFLVDETKDALEILLKDSWAQAMVHLLLPEYMTNLGSPVFEKCLAIWRCTAIDDAQRITWQFETSLGTFTDPMMGIESSNAVQVSKLWTC